MEPETAAIIADMIPAALRTPQQYREGYVSCSLNAPLQGIGGHCSSLGQIERGNALHSC